MNSIQSLLEGANPWKALQGDAARLAAKWSRTGLLEGLKSETDKNNMSMMLENQAKQLVMETSQTGAGTAGAAFTAGVGEQWAGVALPLVRKVFGQIAAKEFVSVQPMNLPSGLVFFLDFQYGTTKSPFTAAAGNGFYGTESMYGVTNPGANTAPNGGLYGAGRFSYTINNTASFLTATVATASWSDFNFDSNYSASATAGTGTPNWKKVTVTLPANTDFNGVRAFTVASQSGFQPSDIQAAYTSTTGTVFSGATGTVTFLVTGSLTGQVASLANVTASFQLQPTDQLRGDFEDGNNSLNSTNSPISIPEVNVKMKSEPIVAKTRKLKAVWTPEFAQDLNAYHALDAEAELTSIMSEYISLEIDLEIMDMLIQNAPIVEQWSAKVGGTVTAGSSNIAYNTSGVYYTQMTWFQTLGIKLQKVSNQIHQRTLRGGANFMVVSPTVATILESIPGFAADTDGAADNMKYAFGVQKIGQLNSRYKVYKNPYMIENTILMGFRGNQFLETGAVYAPYIPLIMTPLVYDPETFTPRKGLMTRYAKKMIRPEFYGKIYITDLEQI
jgi:hypothetical protein